MPPWLVPAALAEPAPPPEDVPSEEIVVWGSAVEQARAAVIAELVGLGYERRRERNGRTVFLAEQAWKGKVVLFDDAYLQVRRRGPSFREVEPLPGTRIRPYPLCVVLPTYCIAAGSWYLSDRRWGGVEDDVARATATPLATLGDRIADQAVAKTIEALPVALEALWEDGQPLLSPEPLRTWPERRAELLAFWDTRTENTWGDRVREVVASFVRAVVEESEHPFTAEERAAFDAGRRSAEPFPWGVEG